MSSRDIELVNEVGISIAKFAEALDVSRQAVARGVKLSDDYFKPATLTKLLGHWQRENEELFRLASSSVRNIYAEEAERILSSIRQNEFEPIDVSAPGEFTLVCADINLFTKQMDICHIQLIEIISKFSSQLGVISFVIDRSDSKLLKPYKSMVPDEKQFIFSYCDYDLAMFPTTLMRIGQNLDIDLFGCSEAGFVGLSHLEASRIRQQILKLKTQ